MTTGELTSMIIYAVQILSSLMMLSMVFVMVIMARSSAERIVEVLDERAACQTRMIRYRRWRTAALTLSMCPSAT